MTFPKKCNFFPNHHSSTELGLCEKSRIFEKMSLFVKFPESPHNLGVFLRKVQLSDFGKKDAF